MAMDLVFGARCLECQWTWNFWSAVPRTGIFGARCLEWQWTWNFWSAVPRMPMDLEFLERGA